MFGVAELQQTVFQVLVAYAPLTALLGTYGGQPAIFDGPLQPNDAGDGTPMPYLSIGWISTAPDDTDTEQGARATVTIHSWAENHALVVVSAIMEQVYRALHRQELAPDGLAFVGCDQIFSEATRDPDGVTVHGIQRFLITFEEV